MLLFVTSAFYPEPVLTNYHYTHAKLCSMCILRRTSDPQCQTIQMYASAISSGSGRGGAKGGIRPGGTV